MTNLFVRILFIILLSVSISITVISQVRWDGGATTSSWFDALNWDTDMVPTATDFVIIPANQSVTIPSAGAVARQVRINANGSLTLDDGASLSLSGSFTHGIFFPNGGRLSIGESANLNISDTFNSGIRVAGGTVTLNSYGTITLGSGISLFGFFVVPFGNNGLNIINHPTGIITTTHPTGDHFMSLARMSSLQNFGMINADLGYGDFDFIQMLGPNSSFVNEEGGIITGTNIGDDGINIDDGATFSNAGTITLTNIEDQAMDISVPGSGINESTGVISISRVDDEEAIDLTTDFINQGVITISDVRSEDGINIDYPGSLENSGIINISLNGSHPDMEAIDIEENASVYNSPCGVINVRSQHPIEISDITSVFINSGAIGSVYAGTNINYGELWNEGEITTSSGSFDIAPNALNIGTVSPSPFAPNTLVKLGSIPVKSLCIEKIPTLGQWAVWILSLLLLIIAMRSLTMLEYRIRS